MKSIHTFLAVLFLTGVWGLSAAPVEGAEGIISKVAAPQGNYCHLKFPAIREETLFSDHPALKDARDGDIINFSGPCDHDPLGAGEIQAQRQRVLRRS